MNYNESQFKAINSQESKILITAGAGTGKTSTLIGAVNKYIEDNPMSNRIILLTFTNQAANEMRERLNKEINFIGTIHSFAIRELGSLAYKYNFRLRFLTPEIIKNLLLEFFNYFDMGDRKYLINSCYNYIMNKGQFLKNKKNKVYPIYKKVEKLYQDYKEDKDMFDFTDAPQYLLKKLKDYDETLNYDAVFIDEGQDLSPDQFELLVKEYTIANKKFIIGDEKQSIYQFSGASSNLFNSIKKEGFVHYSLELNYRSNQEILDFANAELIAAKGKGGKIFNNPQELLTFKPRILCRTNAEVNEIEKYYSNVSTIHAVKGLEYEYVLVIDFPIKDEEDENIMYVALTRAKKGVGLFDYDNVIKCFKISQYKNLSLF